MNLLGIDIGGTKTSVCVGTDAGVIRASKRMSSRTEGALDPYFADLAALCREVMQQAGVTLADIRAVGISAPGPLDVKKGILIAPPNNPGWRDVPVVEITRRNLGLPVYINNDANACALAELHFGNHGVRDLIYLTASTGMGGGIITNGQLVQGPTDTGGEVGHHVIDITGPLCGCGQRGCYEAFVGGRNVAERIRETIRTQKIKTSILDKAGGKFENIDFKLMAEAAREGDAFALQQWDQFIERMAQGIGILIMILNPEVISLGTFAIYEGDFLLVPLRERLRKYAWRWPLDACRVVASPLGSRIGDMAALAVAITGLQAR